MMTYEETMRFGAAQYADVIDTLNTRGLPAEFTQTGGMCAAIMVSLEAGYYLLLTDREDSLSWDRNEHEGWFVGLYEPEERRSADGPLRWADAADGSTETVLELADEVLGRGQQKDSPLARSRVATDVLGPRRRSPTQRPPTAIDSTIDVACGRPIGLGM